MGYGAASGTQTTAGTVESRGAGSGPLQDANPILIQRMEDPCVRGSPFNYSGSLGAVSSTPQKRAVYRPSPRSYKPCTQGKKQYVRTYLQGAPHSRPCQFRRDKPGRSLVCNRDMRGSALLHASPPQPFRHLGPQAPQASHRGALESAPPGARSDRSKLILLPAKPEGLRHCPGPCLWTAKSTPEL